jgi:8-oxo-dGTP pyrophosphatase MutT (NUDIX family)
LSDLFVAAVCALVRKDGKVLAMRRALTKDASPGIWEAVSGRMEPGEDPLEAVHREIREETGLVVRVDPRPWSAHGSRRAGLPMLIVYYVADWISGEVAMSDEHDAWEWLDAPAFAARTPIVPLAEAVGQILT